MNLKTFNLEEARAGKPIVLRDGTPAKFVAVNPDAPLSQRVIFWLSTGYRFCYESGRCFDESHREYSMDLLMAPVAKTVWVNIIKHRHIGDEEANGPWKTKGEADSFKVVPYDRIACVPVTYTEGEGL